MRPSEAEPLLLTADEMMSGGAKPPRRAKGRPAEVADLLVRLYESAGKLGPAARWKAECASERPAPSSNR